MKHIIITTSLFCIFVLVFINCNEEPVGGDCKYIDIRGNANILQYDTTISNSGLNPGYSYADIIFIDSSNSDTFFGTTIIRNKCVDDSILIFKKLYKCTWNTKVSGACAPGIISHVDSLSDSCKFEKFIEK